MPLFLSELLAQARRDSTGLSLTAAMADWVLLDRYTCFCLAEYGQVTQRAIAYHDLPNGRRIMKALCRHDFECFDTDGWVIPNAHL